MSLSGYFADIITGEPLGYSDSQTAAGQAADEQNVLLNQQLAASGQLSQSQVDQIQQDYSTNADTNVGSAATTGFVTGVEDQASSLVNAVTAPFAAAGTVVKYLIYAAILGAALWAGWLIYKEVER
jgi:hypothetical protein